MSSEREETFDLKVENFGSKLFLKQMKSGQVKKRMNKNALSRQYKNTTNKTCRSTSTQGNKTEGWEKGLAVKKENKIRRKFIRAGGS